MNWIFGLYVVYGLVQVNLRTVDKSCGTPGISSVCYRSYMCESI
jgi:hypothetical protein